MDKIELTPAQKELVDETLRILNPRIILIPKLDLQIGDEIWSRCRACGVLLRKVWISNLNSISVKCKCGMVEIMARIVKPKSA